MNENLHDLIIIGSGPAGLTAALYASRASLKPIVLAGQNPGGQLMTTTEVENFPGFPQGIQGPELMQNMMTQVERFGTTILTEYVTSVNFASQPLTITTNNTTYAAKAVIIATGAEANWLNLPGEQRLRGKGVSACATCDGFFFKDKAVVVAGGGDSAMEEANFLTKFASHVTLIHRSQTFRASKIMLDRAKANPKITIIADATIEDVHGEAAVEFVRIKHNASGEMEDIPAQGFFAAIGHTPATKLFAEAGINTNAKGYIVPTEHTMTNIPGVFVCGDVHDDRYRQAISAAGEGCKAALDAEKYLAELE